jgi:hypothetical protein
MSNEIIFLSGLITGCLLMLLLAGILGQWNRFTTSWRTTAQLRAEQREKVRKMRTELARSRRSTFGSLLQYLLIAAAAAFIALALGGYFSQK